MSSPATPRGSGARREKTIASTQAAVLPGGFGMSFTGMRVKYARGSQFHGVGVTIDRPSAPSVQDHAAGIDRELVDGIAAVSGP